MADNSETTKPPTTILATRIPVEMADAVFNLARDQKRSASDLVKNWVQRGLESSTKNQSGDGGKC